MSYSEVGTYGTSTLVLKRPANLSQLFNQFNNITGNHTSRDPDNVAKCTYYDIEEIQTMNISDKSKSLSMFHTTYHLANHLAYNPRTDLQIYKKCNLKSTFIEIINHKKSNIIPGCIYRHRNMDLNDFNNDYLNPLLVELSKEKKTVFLLGDYNVDLSKYEQHFQVINFSILLPHLMFLPHII